MSEELKITIKDSQIEPTILRMNYEALEYLSWFLTDSQNVQNWAGSIFRGGVSTSDPKLVELLTAANKSIQETENDIASVKEYLANIIPTPTNKI
jgi:hypothetical protein